MVINLIGSFKQIATDLLSKDWKVIVDPSIYKLQFITSHHSYLKDRDYYIEGLQIESFFDPGFVRSFIEDTYAFQHRFKPSYYISPNLYIRSFDDQYLDVALKLNK